MAELRDPGGGGVEHDGKKRGQDPLKNMKKIILLLALFLLLSGTVRAIDPSLPNNKVGIHLAVPSDEDIQKAADLVNSTGGKWGYVTLVIQENDRSKDKWQQIFNKLREKRLIPIIRLATIPQGPVWKKPTQNDIKEWVSFLNSLNWVTKDRYIVLFNEPNHGQEWGGSVNPEDYAAVSYDFAKALKEKNKDFFIMLAGLDAIAPNQPPSFEDAATFLSRMTSSKKELFDFIDGWSSHSYPNPDFAGSPTDRGKNTVASYQWELEYLSSLGVSKQLPVFITETGWPHNGYSPQTIGDFLKQTYEELWFSDDRVRAATPFILNYQTPPFLEFSWQKPESTQMYEHYDIIKNMHKTEGSPEQIEKGKVMLTLPKELLIDSTYSLPIKLQNRGQALWDKDEGYRLKTEEGEIPDSFFADVVQVAPTEDEDVLLFIKTGSQKTKNKVKISLFKGEKKLVDGGYWTYVTGPLPKITFRIPRFPKLTADDKRTYEIQIFDSSEQLVFKKKGLRTTDTTGVLEQVRNVYPGGRYRIVILSDYYLPRQSFVVMKKDFNTINFKPMIPADFHKDGRFDLADIITFIRNPKFLFLLFP